MARKSLVCALCVCLCSCLGITGCASLGTTRLRADQVDYARALGDAKKREILSEMVGIRYADPPGFLSVTQIIAAYQFGASSNAQLNAGPDLSAYTRGDVAAAASYSNNPTFTFTPTTGEALATEYINPLPPAMLLPLAESSVPVDLLFRLTMQSIGGLQNASTLAGPNSDGSAGFFELLAALRRLQIAGDLTVGYSTGTLATDQHGTAGPAGHVASRHAHGGHATAAPSSAPATASATASAPAAHNSTGSSSGTGSAASTQAGVTLTLADASNASGRTSAQTLADLRLVRQLLHLSSTTRTYPVVYGASAGPDEIPMLTRSVMGILSDLGGQIEVPAADVKRGATMPTVGLIGGEARPTVIVHSGTMAPSDAFVAIRYRGIAYWIDNDDFDSKYALGIVQAIDALAQADQTTPPPVLTVNAG